MGGVVKGRSGAVQQSEQQLGLPWGTQVACNSRVTTYCIEKAANVDPAVTMTLTPPPTHKHTEGALA